MKEIYFFIGTTAELIKVAPVIAIIKKKKQKFNIISTNQNNLRFVELKAIFGSQKATYTFMMKPFKHPKNIYLRFLVWIVKSVGNYIIYFREIFKNKTGNVLFVIHGDTITAVIGAIVAKICKVKLVHIESGLRSFDFFEPFPEEINRFVISLLADVHFCPNKWAVYNLKYRGGIKVNTINNTIFESTQIALKQKLKPNVPGLKTGKYFVFVLHRQEHTLFNKSKSKNIINQIIKYSSADMKCIFIMHKLTRDYLQKQRIMKNIKRNRFVILPERLPYVKFVKLLKDAEFVATDGGSNQEECNYMGKPCLILRSKTERIEGLGKNAVLSGNDENVIKDFIENYSKYKRPNLKMANKPSQIIYKKLLTL